MFLKHSSLPRDACYCRMSCGTDKINKPTDFATPHRLSFFATLTAPWNPKQTFHNRDDYQFTHQLSLSPFQNTLIVIDSIFFYRKPSISLLLTFYWSNFNLHTNIMTTSCPETVLKLSVVHITVLWFYYNLLVLILYFSSDPESDKGSSRTCALSFLWLGFQGD